MTHNVLSNWNIHFFLYIYVKITKKIMCESIYTTILSLTHSTLVCVCKKAPQRGYKPTGLRTQMDRIRRALINAMPISL